VALGGRERTKSERLCCSSADFSAGFPLVVAAAAAGVSAAVFSGTFSAISATAPFDSLCFFFAGPMTVDCC
jgi:hypothetical protein